jgi:hypothetical protein
MIRAIILAALFAAAPAFADPPAARTIDMTAVITDMHGKPIPDASQAAADDPKCDKCGPLTLGTVVASALLAERKDEPNLSTLDKAKRGALAVRVLDDKAAVLTTTQIAEIVRLLNIWSGLVIARAIPLLDPNIDLNEKK